MTDVTVPVCWHVETFWPRVIRIRIPIWAVESLCNQFLLANKAEQEHFKRWMFDNEEIAPSSFQSYALTAVCENQLLALNLKQQFLSSGRGVSARISCGILHLVGRRWRHRRVGKRRSGKRGI